MQYAKTNTAYLLNCLHEMLTNLTCQMLHSSQELCVLTYILYNNSLILKQSSDKIVGIALT